MSTPVTLHNALGDQLHDVFLCEEAAQSSLKMMSSQAPFLLLHLSPRGTNSYR